MRWPPFRHVFFDCDSTLASVEGIDVLADAAGKGWRVSVLTQAAMDGEVPLEEVYGKRLSAVKPTRGQVRSIAQVYKKFVIEDARDVMIALQKMGHQVYIISGGLEEAVAEFGMSLKVPRKNIRAVSLEFDRLSGEWWRSDNLELNPDERYVNHEQDLLTLSQGKATLIREFLRDQNGRSMLVGDGVSDLLAQSAVDLFVGYGGVVNRPRVALEAPVFLTSQSLAPVLAVAAGPAGLRRLRELGMDDLLERCIRHVDEGALSFTDDINKRKFERAYEISHQTFHTRTN